MDFLLMTVSAGIWPALPVTGYFLFAQRLSRSEQALPFTTLVSLATVVGIIVWSPLLLISAIGGVYRGWFFGFAGWMICLIAVTRRKRWKLNDRAFHSRLTPWETLWASGLLLVGVLYFGFPTESIYGGIDEGVYANHGVSISHRGTLEIPFPWPEKHTALFVDVCGDDKCLFPGFYKTPHGLTAQFGHVLPTWLAQAYSTAGYCGLFRVNAFFALLSVCVFYGLLSTLMNKPIAIVAALVLALNPSQLWIARISLSEVLAQLLIWSGLLVFLLAQQREDRVLAYWAGAVLGVSVLARLDCLFLVPILFVTHLAQYVVARPKNASRMVWASFYQSALPTFILAVGYYATFSAPYFVDHCAQVFSIGVATFASLVVLAAARPPILNVLRLLAKSTHALVIMGLLLVSLTVYGYWFVPAVTPFFWGKNSLSGLARYLSPMVVFAAVFGWYWAWCISARKERTALIFPWIATASFAVLYLGYHLTVHYHFWVVRRLVPVVIPGFVFFAAFGAWWLGGRLPRKVFPAICGAIVVGLVWFLARADRPLLAFAEHKGYFAQVRNLADKVPVESPVLALVQQEANQWPTPLYVSFDRKVIPVNPQHPLAGRVFDQWVNDQTRSGKPVYILCEDGPKFPGATVHEIDRVALFSSFIEAAAMPLPKRKLSQNRAIRLLTVSGTSSASEYLNVDLGSEWYWGVSESGFYNQEVDPSGRNVRWTNGRGRLAIPIDEKRPPRFLEVAVRNVKEDEVRMSVLVNGVLRHHTKISGNSRYVKTMSLSEVPRGRQLCVELLSDTFVPARVMKRSSDLRTLGMLVESVKLMNGPEERGD